MLPCGVATAVTESRRWVGSATRLVLALVILAASLPGAGHTATHAPATSPLREITRGLVASGAPGAVAVLRTTNEIDGAAAGVAQIRPRLMMHIADRYRIASVTKTFVATVVLQLVAKGRIRLSDAVERWLPGLVPNGRSITIRELLNHTSGLFDYDDDRAWVKSRIEHPGRPWSPRKLVAISTRHRPLFRAGTDWSYSNTNYVVLGLVVEAVTGTTLERQLRDRIVRPLMLSSTSYPKGTALTGKAAHGYLGPAPGLPIPLGQLLDVTSIVSPSAWGAGQMVSNAADVTRFFAALLGGQLLPAAELAAMKTRVKGVHRKLGVQVAYSAPYGLGIAIEHTACGMAYGHDGDVPGYRNVVWATPDGRRVATVMVNIQSARLPWSTIRKAAQTAFCSG
jgi:D-alanyl-D-alanine carboxypeptidase